MWEKMQTEDSEKQTQTKNKLDKNILFPPSKVTKKNTNKPSNVLTVQTIVSLVLLCVAIMLSKMGQTGEQDIQKYTQELLQTGVNPQTQDEIIKFASNIIDNITKSPEEPDMNGEGGNNPVKQADFTPENATEKPYTIEQKPFMPAQGYLTSGFGGRTHPITNKEDYHLGEDIANEENTLVYSAFSGVVLKVGYDDVRGNYMEIKHADNLVTKYSHLNYIFAKEGDTLTNGEFIASMGSTGMSTGNHLHFEIMINNIYVDPSYIIDIPVRDTV